jgi:histidine triad (HIT) family protein
MDECVFCKIVAGTQDAQIIYQDEWVMSFLDIHPIRIGHTLIIPKAHYETILDISDDELAHLIKITKKIAKQVKIAMNAVGLRIGNNNYVAAGQIIPHLHFHIIPVTEEFPINLKFDRFKLSEEELEQIAEKIRNSELSI